MRLSPSIIQLLSAKSGLKLNDTSHCAQLVRSIEESTHEHLGVNTMKRLLGFIPDERSPRLSTLNVLAHYLGFESWQQLVATADDGNSDFDVQVDELRSRDLLVNQRVFVSYLPDRELTLVYLGDEKYKVEKSLNSKLRMGDVVTISHFILHYPLIVSEVMRGNETLGNFTAGKFSGLTDIKKVKGEKGAPKEIGKIGKI